MNMPRIAIVGTGAMGSVYAGLFAEAGYQTSVVDLWQEHMTAIGKTGLHLEGASGDRVIGGINAVHQIADLGPIDLYVIATKANGVGWGCGGNCQSHAAGLAGSDNPERAWRWREDCPIYANR